MCKYVTSSAIAKHMSGSLVVTTLDNIAVLHMYTFNHLQLSFLVLGV